MPVIVGYRDLSSYLPWRRIMRLIATKDIYIDMSIGRQFSVSPPIQQKIYT